MSATAYDHRTTTGRPNRTTTGRPQDDAERRTQRFNAGAHTPLRILWERGDATRYAPSWFRSVQFQHSPHAPRLPVAAAGGDDDDSATLLQQQARRQAGTAGTDSTRRRRQTGAARRPGDGHGKRMGRHARDGVGPTGGGLGRWWLWGLWHIERVIVSGRKTAHGRFVRSRITASRSATVRFRALRNRPGSNDLGTNS